MYLKKLILHNFLPKKSFEHVKASQKLALILNLTKLC